MINVFAAVGPVVAAVNPPIGAWVRISDGATVNADFSTTPNFADIPLTIEVQAVSTSDLQHVENITQQSDMRVVYLIGGIRALNRPLQIGGDVLIFYGSEWLVTQGIEEWGNGQWSKVLVTRQRPPSP